MSRVLKLNKRRIIVGFLLLFCVTGIVLGISSQLYVVSMLFFFSLVLIVVNHKLAARMQEEVAPFRRSSRVRNVDVLIIGEICKIKELPFKQKESYIKIMAPERSLTSSYEILRHTFSILRPKGTVVIAPASTGGKKYSIFDIAHFTEYTIKRLNLEKMQKLRHFPLFAAPVCSVRYMLGWAKVKEKSVCPSKEIVDFCKERDFQLFYME